MNYLLILYFRQTECPHINTRNKKICETSLVRFPEEVYMPTIWRLQTAASQAVAGNSISSIRMFRKSSFYIFSIKYDNTVLKNVWESCLECTAPSMTIRYLCVYNCQQQIMKLHQSYLISDVIL